MSKGMTPTFAPAGSPWRWLAPVVALWHNLIGAWRVAIARRPEVLLDGRVLRDLGLCRCELQSYLAEVDGSAEATRRRAIEQRHALML